MLIRCSSLADIMTNAQQIEEHLMTPELDKIKAKKKRTDEETALYAAAKSKSLSQTAKSRIETLVKLELFGFRREISSKEMSKGHECEDEAIQLLGALHFKKYMKHEGRVETELLSGECDVLTNDAVHDLKCPWDLQSFPLFKGDAEQKVIELGYDWQMRGYMMLYDRPVAHVHFILLPTPTHLLRFGDDEYMHRDCVESVPLKHRIRTVTIERDLAIEEKIKERVVMAQRYAENLILDIS